MNISLVIFTIIFSKSVLAENILDKVKGHFKDVGCKLHQANMKLFPHTHHLGPDPCAYLQNKTLDESGNNQNGSSSLNTNNQGTNHPHPENLNFTTPNYTTVNGLLFTFNEKSNNNVPPKSNTYVNNQNGGNQSSNNIGQDSPNQGTDEQKGQNVIKKQPINNPDGQESHKSSTDPKTNALIFPDDVDSSEKISTKVNTNLGTGVVFPDNAEYLNSPNGRRILNNQTRRLSTTPKQSSKRRKNNEDYSEEEVNTKHKYVSEEETSLETSTSIESNKTVVPVDAGGNGKRILSNVKANCKEGYVADLKGICREKY